MRVFCFLCALIGLAAQAATVETNGWVLSFRVPDVVQTNLDAALRWGTNTVSGAYNVWFGTQSVNVTYTTVGFDDSTPPAITTLSNRVSAGRILRLPYPASQLSSFVADVSQDGGGVRIRSSLSDWLCAGDSNVSVSVSANTYGTNASFTEAVTNLSIYPSPAPFGNWSWPGHRVATNNTLLLRASVWHWAARRGRTVAAVGLIVQDAHGHAVTNWVREMTPNLEYEANVDISTMTPLDPLRCDFIAFPWVGTNILWSGDGVNSAPPLYCTQTNFCDRTGSYGQVCAVVDAANGNDATGVAVPRNAIATNPPAFATANIAAVALKGTNFALYGHLDTGGGTLFLTNGAHNLSTGGAYGTGTVAHLTIAAHPNSVAGSVYVFRGDGGFATRTHYLGLSFTNATDLGYWCIESAWFEACSFNTTSAAFFYSDGPWSFWTSCIISNLNGNGGLRGYSTKKAPAALVRDCVFPSGRCYVPAYCTMGNRFDTQLSGTISDGRINGEMSAVPAIVVNNRIYRSHTSSGAVNVGSASNALGCAFVQNLLECTNSASTALVGAWADGVTNTLMQGCFWNNTCVGQRINFNYNDRFDFAVVRRFISVRGNVLNDYNIKSDLFSGYTQDGARVGNWASLWGVGYANNVFRWASVGAGILNSQSAENGGWDGVGAATYSLPGQLCFRDFQAATNSGTSLGGGDYSLRTESPVTFMCADWRALPYDLDGRRRGNTDPPGALCGGQSRRVGINGL